MNTHELANALRLLAKALKQGPKIEIDDIDQLLTTKMRFDVGSNRFKVGLNQLGALSRIDKTKWLDLIEEYNFPIATRPRDASWDVIGKVLRYLEKTPEAREKIKRTIAYDTGKASPELMKALSILLKD